MPCAATQCPDRAGHIGETPMRRSILFLAIPILMCGFAFPAWAQTNETLRFDVRLLGARVGVMTIAARESAAAYSARSVFSTAGIAGALKKLKADVAVTGRLNGGRYTPHDYTEAVDDGRRQTDVRVKFAPGTPRLISGDTGSSAPPANPSLLGAAIDPLTALYAVLQDQHPDQACQFASDVYDGHRLARMVLNQPKPSEGGLTCNGHYSRIAGYSSKSKQARTLAISIEYDLVDDVMRATRVNVQTRYGLAMMQRR